MAKARQVEAKRQEGAKSNDIATKADLNPVSQASISDDILLKASTSPRNFALGGLFAVDYSHEHLQAERKQLHKINQEIEALKREKVSLTEKMQDAVRDRDLAQQMLDNLDEEQTATKATHEHLTIDTRRLTMLADEQKQIRREMQEKNAHLLQKVQMYRAKMAQLEELKEKTDREVQHYLVNVLEKMRHETDVAERERTELANTTNDVGKEKERLKQKIGEIRAHQRALKEQLGETERQRQNLQTEVQGLASELKRLDARLKHLSHIKQAQLVELAKQETRRRNVDAEFTMVALQDEHMAERLQEIENKLWTQMS